MQHYIVASLYNMQLEMQRHDSWTGRYLRCSINAPAGYHNTLTKKKLLWKNSGSDPVPWYLSQSSKAHDLTSVSSSFFSGVDVCRNLPGGECLGLLSIEKVIISSSQRRARRWWIDWMSEKPVSIFTRVG